MGGAPSLGLALVLGAASGAAVVVAGPPDGRPVLLFVALVPLLLATRCGWWSAATAGAACGVVVYLGAVSWIAPVTARVQGASPLVGAALAGAFVLYHQMPYALAAVAARALQWGPASACGAGALAAAWVLVEWAFPMLLPWTIGSLLGPSPALRQAAAWGGAYGLTFAVVLVNALLAAAILGWRQVPARAGRAALLAAGVVLALWGGGHLMLLRREPARPALRVAVVQGALPAERGDLAAANARAWTSYTALSQSLAGSSDLVVWPESTLRVVVRDNPSLRRRIEQLAATLRAPLLFGGLDGDGRGALMNAALLVESDAAGARWAAPYRKLRLVPFGEYVPWVGPALPGWRTTGDLTPGSDRQVLAFSAAGHGTALAPSICFEAIVPGWFNGLVRDGAQVLVNLTDDAWFDDSHAAAQHLEMTRLRAVETRRWLVRASNSGVSAIIDPYGEIVASLPYGASGTLQVDVERRDDRSPYVRAGDWVVVASALIVALRLATLARQRRRDG